jgi:alpha-glucosidase
MNGAAWWQTAVIYQVMVRSFQDSNDDGNGDFAGLIARLDYFVELGVDAVWLSPIYDSPWKEGGYDISDYEQVHPAYGSLADFDRLLDEAHRRNLRIILDWVPNHTSHQHPWFLAACRSRDDPRRDWYVWADPRPGGGEPNNWLSVFGGSAWTWHEPTRQYYFHAFLAEQPDLNLRNPAVRAALDGNLEFWCRRGVDGFRIDAADMLQEDRRLRDNPLNPDFQPEHAPDNAVLQQRTRDQRATHIVLAEFRRVIDRHQGRVLLGESYLPLEKLVTYFGTPRRPELHLPLNLRLLYTPWQADEVQSLLEEYYRRMPAFGWPCWSLGNHDIGRLASRLPAGQERVAAMLLLTLRGTPTLYYGDEIGMQNASIPSARALDPQAKSWPGHGRDVARTPMQWDGLANAGFTRGKPWLPLATDWPTRHIEAVQRDPNSLWSLYRQLIALRRREPALSVGERAAVTRRAPLVAFERRDAASGRRILVALNLSGQSTDYPLAGGGNVLLSTQLDRQREEIRSYLNLRANEGLVVELL